MPKIDSKYTRGYGASFGFFIVLLLYSYSYSAGCFLSLSIPFFMFVLLTHALSIKKIAQRKCLAQCYFYEGNFFYSFLHKRFMPYLSSAFFVLLSLPFLLAFLLLSSKEFYLLLALDVFLLVSLYYLLINHLSKVIKKPYDAIFLSTFLSWINTFVLVVAFALYSYYAPIPYDFSGSYEQNLKQIPLTQLSSCGISDYFLRLYLELHFLSWFAWDYATTLLESPLLVSLLTLFFLLGGMAIFYLLSRFFLEALRLSDAYFTKE